MEKKITSYRTQEIRHQNQRNSSSDASPAPLTRLLPADSCSHALDHLVSVMSQLCDKDPRNTDVDLVNLSGEVCNRLTAVPCIVQHLLFADVDEYMTRLALESEVRQEVDGERERVKSLLLVLEERLRSVEERMCKLLHSIEKRKGCWVREVSRLLSEVVNKSCRAKLPGARVPSHPHRPVVHFKEMDQVLDSVVIDSSLTAEDELDVHLRLLEQKIRTLKVEIGDCLPLTSLLLVTPHA